jgi:SAM-dependent methyltransferase
MFDLDYLQALRREEMRRIEPLLPSSGDVLEIGAGTGEQARYLADRGFEVVAIDLPASSYSEARVFPITDYDGRHIPLPDCSIDVVFSSNVLEHVEDIPQLFAEIRRVLRPSGFAVHVMPTVMWRLTTFATGIPTAIVAAFRIIPDLLRPSGTLSRKAGLATNVKTAVAALLPVGHGTSSEGFSELVTFSRWWWRRKFARYGFIVEAEQPIRLAYTGHMMFGRHLSFDRRQQLSRYAGSATRIYVVRAVRPTDSPGY